MSDENKMVPLLSNAAAIARQKEEGARPGRQHLRVLAWDAKGLFQGQGWVAVQQFLRAGNAMQVLTMSPAGAGAAQLVAAGRAAMAEPLREARRVREEALRDWCEKEPLRGDALRIREVDWLPGTSLCLYADGDGKGKGRVGFVGMSTPNPNRKTADKLWIELGAGKRLDGQIEQFDELWKMGVRPKTRSVFLSYAHTDTAIADHVEALLRRQDVKVFRDTAHVHSGAPYLQELLMRQVSWAGVLLILWSADWEASLWCRAELAEALRTSSDGGPAIEVLRVGESRNDAPELSLRGRLFREGLTRAEREQAVRLMVTTALGGVG
jgi:hypothetical protein